MLTCPFRLLISLSFLSPALNLRRQPHLDPWRWRWSWSTLTTKSKTPSGPTPPALTWRSADWASTTATLSPPASTPPPPMSATAREVTREMARCTATRRRSHEPATLTHAAILFIVITRLQFFPPADATMSVGWASAAAAHASSVSALSVGHLTRPPWFSAELSVTWTVAATFTPPASPHQGSVTNAKV